VNFQQQNVQKIILVTLLFAGVIYIYFGVLLPSLNKRAENIRQACEELRPRIADAKSHIKGVAIREEKAGMTAATFDQVNAMMPHASPIAWVPPLLKEFFDRHGIKNCSVRMIGKRIDADIPGYYSAIWNIHLPQVEAIQLGIALSELENQQPLFEITSVQMGNMGPDVEIQNATINILTIVRE